LFCAFCMLFFLLGFCEKSGAEQSNAEEGRADRDWSITLYGAKLSTSSLGQVLILEAEYKDSYLVDLALSRRFASYKKYLDFEAEGQVAKHFGDQDHWEFVALVVVRWLPFPWDRYVDTSFAAGNGLSYASETPKLEDQKYDDTSQLLNYLMFELAFSLPRIPSWSFVVRIHHRSGVLGLFNDVKGASNALGLGIKYSF
ncbi:MAG: hypothetical protein PVI19_00680, partial [Syntrophobacterales bacterium]